MSYLGIDIGSAGCKALCFSADGTPYYLAYREYPTRFDDDGTAELDSRVVGESCLAVIREAATACPATDPVQALAVSSHGEAFTPVSREGQYLTPAMISSDTRSAPVVKRWQQNADSGRLYEVTGHTAHSMFTLFKLLYLKT